MTILGPCRCQGCGEDVYLTREGDDFGWLHASGVMRCPRRRDGLSKYPGVSRREYQTLWMRDKRASKWKPGPRSMFPGVSRKEYQRLWMREHRARMAAGADGDRVPQSPVPAA